MSEPKVEYDVDMEKEAQHESGYIKYIDMMQGHQNVKITFNSVKEATNAQKAICMLINRRKLYDVTQIRRKNAIYLVKEELDGK